MVVNNIGTYYSVIHLLLYIYKNKQIVVWLTTMHSRILSYNTDYITFITFRNTLLLQTMQLNFEVRNLNVMENLYPLFKSKSMFCSPSSVSPNSLK